MTELTPTRIEWSGPQGWLISLNEDMICLHSRNVSLEEVEIEELLRIYAEAKRCRANGASPIPAVSPRVVTPEYEHTARRVFRAIERAANNDKLPF